MYLLASVRHPRRLFFLRPPITLQHEVSQSADWMILFVPVVNFVDGAVDGAVVRRAVMTDPEMSQINSPMSQYNKCTTHTTSSTFRSS